MSQCTATSKRSGQRCGKWAITGSNVCRLHGALGGRLPRHYRYAESLKSPILRRAWERMVLDAADDFDLSEEILLLRARLAAAIEDGVDVKIVNEIQRDLIKAVQKNTELQIKRQGLIQKSEAEGILRKAVQVLAGYVPPANRGAAFAELAKLLSAGSWELEREAVVAEVRELPEYEHASPD